MLHLSMCAVPPVITSVEDPVTVTVGNTATLSCTASGDPAPIQSWSLNGVGVAGPRFQVSGDGSTLTVTGTTEGDEGTYTCHASNPASSVTDTVFLNVIGGSHVSHVMIM